MSENTIGLLLRETKTSSTSRDSMEPSLVGPTHILFYRPRQPGSLVTPLTPWFLAVGWSMYFMYLMCCETR